MRIGSLFSGAGGLDMAVEQVFGATTAWHCELDPAASKVLAHRWPGVPNLGDITKVDWAAVEPVDIICGGFPCQDVSSAGRRAGIRTGTRSGLWAIYADAIAALRPSIVVIENVRGLLSAQAHRAVECADAAVGDGSNGPVLRAAGAVLGDLADIGYDAQWATVAASDVGAPHRRERVFVVAHTQRIGQQRPAHNSPSGQSDVAGGDLRLQHDRCATTSTRGPHRERRLAAHTARDGWNRITRQTVPGAPSSGAVDGGALAPHSSRDGWHEGRPESARLVGGSDAAAGGAGPVELLPTPRHSDAGPRGGTTGFGLRNWTRDYIAELLPTPTSCDHKPTDSRSDHERHSPGLGAVSYHFLPTPSVADGMGGHMNRSGDRKGELLLPGQVRELAGSQWGKYEPAIRRWETLTRPAPAPTEPNTKGNPRLAAAFSEWMLGWPAGWVTAVPGISRNDALRIVGNGVCPQQATAALRWLLTVSAQAA